MFVCLLCGLFLFFYCAQKYALALAPPAALPALLDPLRCGAGLGCVALALDDARCLLRWRRRQCTDWRWPRRQHRSSLSFP